MSILDTRGVQEGSPPAEAHDSRSALDSLALELRAKAPDLVVFVAKASEVDAAVDADVDVLERVYKEVKRAHRTEPPLVAVVTHCDLFEPKGTRLHRRPPRSRADDVEEKLRYVSDGRARDRGARSTTAPALRDRARRDARRLDVHVVARRRRRSAPTSAGGSTTSRVMLFRHLPDASRAELARATGARAVQEELATTLTRATAAVCAGHRGGADPARGHHPAHDDAGRARRGDRVDRGPLGRQAGRGASFSAGSARTSASAFALREAVRAIVKVIAPGGGSVVSATIAFSGTHGHRRGGAGVLHPRAVARRRAQGVSARPSRSEGRRRAEARDIAQRPGLRSVSPSSMRRRLPPESDGEAARRGETRPDEGRPTCTTRRACFRIA